LNHHLLGFLGGLLLVLGSCNTTAGLYFVAPQQLGAEAEMRRPGFWISRLPDPDQIVMDAGAIEELNRSIVEDKHLRNDLFRLEAPSPETLTKRFAGQITAMEKRHLFDAGLKPVTQEFWKAMRGLVTPPDSPSTVRWALAVKFTHQRILPSDANLNAEVGDVEFDELQNSGIDIGTAFQVLQESFDRQWVFAITPLSEGWVKASDLAFGSAEEIQAALNQPMGVVVSARSDCYSDSGRRAFRTLLRMGTRFPLIQAGPVVTEIRVPDRDGDKLVWTPAWVATPDLSPQPLPYTRRTIIEQAFQFLNSPYGWGDEGEEQDCSSFVRMVFETVGVHLPRNSAAQGRSAASIAVFQKATPRADRLAQIAAAPAGNTLLQMQGHIMLYLGQYRDLPWAISEIWAYHEDASTGSRIRVINRTSVTPLDLGSGSKSGSLLERLVNVTEVASPNLIPTPVLTNP
jgi:hypothetical protein